MIDMDSDLGGLIPSVWRAKYEYMTCECVCRSERMKSVIDVNQCVCFNVTIIRKGVKYTYRVNDDIHEDEVATGRRVVSEGVPRKQ